MKKYSLAIIFALMIAGGLGLRFLYAERPDAVVGEAIRKLKDTKSVMVAATVGTFAPEAVIRAAGADPNLVFLPIVFVGEAAVNIPADHPVSGTATFELIGNDKTGKAVTFHVITTDDGTSYVEFENVPAEKTSAQVVQELNSKWYSMRSRGLAALLAKDGEATADQEDPSGKTSAAAWTRIRETVSSGELFGLPVQEGNQVLGSVTAHRYDLPLKHDVLVRLAQDIKTLVRGRSLTDAERAEVAQTMEDRDVSVQVWVDKTTKRLLQANLDVKTLGLAPEDKQTKTTTLSLLVRFTAWDQPVDVKAPEGATPFADLIQQLKNNKKR